MKQEEGLKKYFPFDCYECGKAEKFLEQMAAKGWLLKEVSHNTFHFVKMKKQPIKYAQHIKYAVKVFDGAGPYDLIPGKKGQTYLEYCQQAGWKFIDNFGKIYYFYTEAEHPVPIDTDARLERRAVIKGTLQRDFFLMFFAPILSIYFFRIMSELGMAFLITRYIMLFSLFGMGTVLLLALVKIVDFVTWCIQSGEQVRNGSGIKYRTRAVYPNRSSINILLALLGGMAIIGVLQNKIAIGMISLLLVILLLLCIGLENLFKKIQLSNKISFWLEAALGVGLTWIILIITGLGMINQFQGRQGEIIQAVDEDGTIWTRNIYHDELPLTLDDFGLAMSGIHNSRRDEQTTFLASRIWYDEYYEEDDNNYVSMFYEIFSSPYSWIIEQYYEYEMEMIADEPDWETISSEPWGAVAAYRSIYEDDDEEYGEFICSYLVIYEGAVFQISCPMELTKEQITLIRARMHEEIMEIPAPDMQAADAAQEQCITVWAWDDTFNVRAMKLAAQQYGNTHPEVQINVIAKERNEIVDALTNRFSSKVYQDLPDIVLMEDYVSQYMLKIYESEFEELTDTTDFSQFMDYKTDVTSVDGEHYGIPFDSGTAVMFYRLDYLEAAGYTAADMENITWDKYIEMGEAVREKTGKYMTTIDPNDLGLFRVILQSAGSWYVADDGVTVDIEENQALKDAIHVYQKLLAHDVALTSNGWNQFITGFQQEQVATVVIGCWAVSNIKEITAQDGKWRIAKIPRMGENDESVNASNIGGSSWFLLKNGSRTSMAKDFLVDMFADNTVFMDTLIREIGIVPAWKEQSVFANYDTEDAFFGGQRTMEFFAKTIDEVPDVNYGMYTYEIEEIFAEELQSILKGNEEANSLSKVQAKAEALCEN